MDIISHQLVIDIIGKDCAGIVDDHVMAMHRRKHQTKMSSTIKFFYITKILYKERPLYANAYNTMNLTRCFDKPFNWSAKIVKTTDLANATRHHGISPHYNIIQDYFCAHTFIEEFWRFEAFPHKNKLSSRCLHSNIYSTSNFVDDDTTMILHRSEYHTKTNGYLQYKCEWECKICCQVYKTAQSAKRHVQSKKHIKGLLNLRRGRLSLMI